MSDFTRTKNWYEKRGEIYVTTKPVIWGIGTKGSGFQLVIPEGTPFDVSIPKWVWSLFDRHDPKYFKAALVHDVLLRKGWSRLTAGGEFHRALVATKVSVRTRFLFWLAVSLRKCNW